MRRLLYFIIIFLAVCFFASCPVKAQQKDKKLSVVYNSGNFVDLDITLVGEKTTKLKVPEGGLIRIQVDGKFFGLSPRLIDLKSQKVSLDFFEIKKELKNDTVISETFNLLTSLNIVKQGKNPSLLISPLTDNGYKLWIRLKRVYKSK